MATWISSWVDRFGDPCFIFCGRARAEELAREHALPLDRLVAAALVEKLGDETSDAKLEERAARGRRHDFDRFMKGAPDMPPQPGDEI